MPICFVIQPFDGANFDDRYEDIFAPAIKDAELDPYRVDKDPSVSIPIDSIEKQIREAAICLADITTDNANVWFELGYAIACNKPVVLICSDERKGNFPFDVQHRSIIRYKIGSPRAFTVLKEQITSRLKHDEKMEVALQKLAEQPQLLESKGMSAIEKIVLATIAASSFSPEDTVGEGVIRSDGNKNGLTPIAVTMGLRKLLKKRYVHWSAAYDRDSEQSYAIYGLTDLGWDWIIENEAEFSLELRPRVPKEGEAF